VGCPALHSKYYWSTCYLVEHQRMVSRRHRVILNTDDQDQQRPLGRPAPVDSRRPQYGAASTRPHTGGSRLVAKVEPLNTAMRAHQRPHNRRRPEKATPIALPFRNCEHVHATTANTPLWRVRSCSCSLHRLGFDATPGGGFTR